MGRLITNEYFFELVRLCQEEILRNVEFITTKVPETEFDKVSREQTFGEIRGIQWIFFKLNEEREKIVKEIKEKDNPNGNEQ